MIHTLITGSILKMGELKTGKNNKYFCQFSISVPMDGEWQLISCMSFGEIAERIAKLAKGDQVALIGSLKLSEWTAATGETKTGLNLTVSQSLTVYDLKKRRSASKAPDKIPQHNVNRLYGETPKTYPFNDQIEF